jgi:stage II sporulation protein AA (anti-sigma F factor antagonist)
MTTYELDPHDSDVPGTVVADVSGELDLTNARHLEERMVKLGAGGERVVLDLNRVTFVDSAALHAMFRIARQLGNGRFGIALAPSAALMRTVTIVGLTDAVPVAPTADDVAQLLAVPVS